MNAILGGQFASRINLNLPRGQGLQLRSRVGFSFLQGPGPFEAGGTVQTAVTKESLVEIIKELTDITGRRPVTDAELAFAKERIIQGFPSRFETTFGVAGQLAILVADDLPDDEFDHYQARIEAVTKADVDRVAREYITPENMTILVVGDRSADRGAAQELAVRRDDPAARHGGQPSGPSGHRKAGGGLESPASRPAHGPAPLSIWDPFRASNLDRNDEPRSLGRGGSGPMVRLSPLLLP